MSYSKSNSERKSHKQIKSHALFSRQISSKISFATIIVVSLLLFFSIFSLASAEAWHEAIVVAVIFVLSGLNIWTNNSIGEGRQILLPILILAVYSFLQGFATILFPVYSFAFPISFDPTASIWSGAKILAFAFFLGLLLKTGRRYIRFLTWSLVFTGNFFAVFGIARYLFQPYFPGGFEGLTSSKLAPGVGFGSYFNQNHFAFLMLMVFGMNICLFWFGKLSKTTKLLLLAASLTTWTAIVLTASRGGIIGSFVEILLLISLPVIQIVKDKRKISRQAAKSYRGLIGKQAAILIITLGLLIAGIFIIGQDRVVERFEAIPGQLGGITNAATFRRTDVWQAALLIIKDFPVFGTGFGGFQVAVSQYIDISGQIVPKQAHNDYLELASSGGLVAVGLAIWFLVSFFSLVKKRFAESPDNFSGAVRAGAICGIAGIALHNFFDFGLQIMANLLFFAALIFVAIHEPQDKIDSTEDSASQKLQPGFRFLFSILCLALAFSAAFFGFARYHLEQVRNNPGSFSESALYKIPFDANYYESTAAIYEDSGNFELAAGELKKVIEYRPRDYNLWIKLGQLEQSQNHTAEAENAYRQAMELAPNYARPHFFYGDFLIKANRKDEGFTELRTALHRNPQYFNEVVSILWAEKAGNADQIIKLLMPLDVNERARLSTFLFEKGEFQGLTKLNCNDPNSIEPYRNGLIQQLLEKKRFYFAEQIYKQNCNDSDNVRGEIEDGNFENQIVKEGTGFGWRVEESSSGNTIVSFDDDTPAKGHSLRFNFNGQDISYNLLSQFVVVEKNRKYRLDFSYKTSEIVTGGIPIVQVILKKPDSPTSENIAGETKLSIKEKDWIQSSIEFETDKMTEAVEIRLTRQPCAESLCPIFGNLWLDDFSLQKKN